MARLLIPDDVWQLIEPLLPPHPPRPKGGRPLIADRDVLTGILFMLKTNIAWEDLPIEMGCGCGMTCLRRLRDWQRLGVWPRIQRILQAHLPDARRINWARAQLRSGQAPHPAPLPPSVPASQPREPVPPAAHPLRSDQSTRVTV